MGGRFTIGNNSTTFAHAETHQKGQASAAPESAQPGFAIVAPIVPGQSGTGAAADLAWGNHASSRAIARTRQAADRGMGSSVPSDHFR